MSDNRDIGYAFLGLGFGLWSFFHGFRIFRKKQLIDNIPTSTVRGMAMGLVELSGLAGRETILKSPLSNESCTAYAYMVERLEHRGKSSTWVKIASGDSFQCSFFVEDDTGRVTIDPRGVEFICEPTFFFETGIFKTTPPNLIGFLQANGISYGGLFGNYTMRFTERVIYPKQQIFVLGTAKKTATALADAEHYKNNLAQRLNVLKSDPKFMADVDTNKDGNISDDEWQKAVMKVEYDLLQNEINAAAQAQMPDVIIGRGDTEKTFIIADKSQKDLDGIFGWQIFGGVVGGASITVACLWYLLFRFHIL